MAEKKRESGSNQAYIGRTVKRLTFLENNYTQQPPVATSDKNNIPFVGLHRDHTNGSHDRPAVMLTNDNRMPAVFSTKRTPAGTTQITGCL